MISGFFIFKIRRKNILEKIDFNDIQKTIFLENMKYVNKGDKITEDYESPFDLVSYTQKFKLDKGMEISEFKCFMERIIKYKFEINILMLKGYKVEIDIHIHSELAQINFMLTSEELKCLDLLGVELNYYILSYGFAENL